MRITKGARRVVTVALAGLLAAALTSCSSDESGSSGDNIRVAVTTGTTSAEIAAAKNYFQARNLTVQISTLATGTETIAAVQGGSADIAYADTFAAVNAISNGFDIELVAGANHTSPAVSYLVRADSDIREPRDLVGKSLGIGGVPFFRVFANGFFEQNRIDPASVKFNVIRQSNALPEALANGAVDAIQTLGYQVAYLNDGIGHRFRTVGNPDTSAFQNPKAMQAGWWTSKKWGERNADAAQRFADGYRSFAAWYNAASVDERSDLSAQYNKIDYRATAGGDQKKLDNLAFATIARYIDAPVDLVATQEWIDKGAAVAPDQVPGGVALSGHVLPSAS
ncbi:ABC transporter substrate-binding protein [Nocardia noduli]|uniref:ABC transporter substrate-binding protein n=1 Tax=Nocardia noduli TaxID=2815722 RepID=UPI001C220A81|nr:ABC transporter substrate-binding protein [Nocardia noduli]